MFIQNISQTYLYFRFVFIYFVHMFYIFLTFLNKITYKTRFLLLQFPDKLFTLLSKMNYAAYPRGTTVENKRSF